MPELKLKHSPTLRSVLMVEDVLKEEGFIKNRTQLLKKLPRKTEFATLTNILIYLEQSSKIYVSMKGIAWAYNPDPKFRKMVKKARMLEIIKKMESNKFMEI